MGLFQNLMEDKTVAMTALAGVALEAAASGDSSPLVRLAAKQTLWEYHLNGYRSPKGADGIASQTVEPPIAAPAGARPVVALVPAPPLPVTALFTPPSTPTAAPVLPPVAPPSGPRLPRQSFLVDLVSGMRNAPPPRPTPTSGPPPILNMTAEPPLAKRPAVTIPVLQPSTPSCLLYTSPSPRD